MVRGEQEDVTSNSNWQRQQYDTGPVVAGADLAQALPQSSVPLLQGTVTHNSHLHEDEGAGVGVGMMHVDIEQEAAIANVMSTGNHHGANGIGAAAAAAPVAGFATTPATLTKTTTTPTTTTTTTPHCLNTEYGGCFGSPRGCSLCSGASTVTMYSPYGSGWDPYVPVLTPSAAKNFVGWSGVDGNDFPVAADQLVMHNETSHRHPRDRGDVFGAGEINNKNQLLHSMFSTVGCGFPHSHQHSQHEVHQAQPQPQQFWPSPTHSSNADVMPMRMRESVPVPVMSLGTGTTSPVVVGGPGYPSSQHEGLLSFQQQQQQHYGNSSNSGQPQSLQHQPYDGMAHHHGHHPNPMIASPNLELGYHHGHNHPMTPTEMSFIMNMNLDMGREREDGSSSSQQQHYHRNFNNSSNVNNPMAGRMMLDNQHDHGQRPPSYVLSMPISMSSGASSNIGISIDSQSCQSPAASRPVAASPSVNINIVVSGVL
ncbi:hypothetical protein QBC32DRAFT_41777 [Pseudoneurospora amorphoporcata]|uniref:Uncharacterized protein n=1 Tax=Pseudoneurospora amorphoporcata TaxID=241081 RepID=A0AAN6NNM1_9PEZI|nr:hypothetical protein QBC32DRAFT_41777 [Pseudoneurospora amorphoporcata]